MTDIQRVDQTGQLQRALSQLPQVDTPVEHHFAPGLYSREMFIPRETLVIGKTHKTEHLNMLMKGSCLVAMDGKITKLAAPYTFKSHKGCKKVVLAIEDTVWMTIHPTEETDLDKLEEELIDLEAEEQINQPIIGELLCHGEQLQSQQ